MTTLDVEITGQGRPLVLLHSLLQDRSSFAGIAVRLSDQRKVFNVNMPGFGTSPEAAPLAGYADRIAEAFDALGIGPEADVVGNGLGGFVGLTLALRHGARFNRLVVVGSAIRFPDPGRAVFRAMADRAEAEGMGALVDQALLRMFAAEFIAANPDRIAPLRAVFLSIRPPVFAAACRALAALDLTDDLAAIRNPVQVIVGEHDSATSATLGADLAAALPNGRLTVLPGGYHAPHLQAPEAFVAAMAPFLDLAV
jgi:3-oxoadipate enol-lactonase